MKNLFLFALSSSLIGIAGVSQINLGSSKLTAGLVIGIIVALLYSGYIAYKYIKSVYFLIDFNIRKLSNRVTEYEESIETLREKISDLKQKLFSVREIDMAIKQTIVDNITVWEDQIEVYKKIIFICQKRISGLTQNKEEVKLLNYLKAQLKNEPNSVEKLKKLETLISKIDGKVNGKITTEITNLIATMKADSRREKIVELKARLVWLEKKVS